VSDPSGAAKAAAIGALAEQGVALLTVISSDTKPWYQSKAVLGAGVALVAGVASLANVSIDPALQDATVTMIMAGATVLGSAVAIIGRIVAKHRLH
jgi:hypothetical protein